MTVTGEIRASGDIIAYNQGNPAPGTSPATASGSSKRYTSGFTQSAGNTVGNGQVLTFTHNLGSIDIVFGFYVADNAGGYDTIEPGSNNVDRGYHIQDVTTTQVKVTLGKSGYTRLNQSSAQWQDENYTGKYVKLVAIA